MNKEKVIIGLEICTTRNDICQYKQEPICPYVEYCQKEDYSALQRDALALLKEQKEQIKKRDESLEKAREEIKWLRGMQDAVEPIEVFKKDTNCHEYHCKRCGNKVGTILGGKHPILPGVKLSIEHFCDVCG